MAVFLVVKDWLWWWLLGSLWPLLSATIGNEQLRAKEVGWSTRQAGFRVATPSTQPILMLASETSTPMSENS